MSNQSQHDNLVRDAFMESYARKWVVGQQAVAKDGFRAGWDARGIEVSDLKTSIAILETRAVSAEQAMRTYMESKP